MRTLLLYLILIAASFSACTPPMYIPNTTSVPTLTKTGDLNIAASVGTNGWDLQSSVAVTDKIGVMLNGSIGSSSNDSMTRVSRHAFSEIGVGYTTFLNETTKDADNVDYLFSVFGGAGLGRAEGTVQFSNIFNSNINYANTIEGGYYRGFIQPSIGFVSSEVEMYFSVRTNYVRVYDLKTDLEADWNNSYLSDEEYELYSSILERKKYNIFYEPTLTLKGGGEKVKIIMQGGLSLGQIPSIETTFRQRPVIIIMGIQVKLNTLKADR